MLGAPDLAGSALDGRYELHALIGEGAFGRVYRGLDRRLARPVAVKVIKPWWAEDSAWVKRFEDEARLLARVSDPGIVQIFDIGHAEQGPYYVAELVDGESLAERLQHGSMSVSEALTIAERLCHALASAHAQGIVHCDVKPANVLLADDGKVKVGDFGVARLAGGTSQALSATVAGTPRYMAPEQARGRRTTTATDVYSAGVVLYEMLAGEPPFAHGSAVELGLRHVQDAPPPLPDDVPAGLRQIVARALEKQPEGRYCDAAEMAVALRSVQLNASAERDAAMPPPDQTARTGQAAEPQASGGQRPGADAPADDLQGDEDETKALGTSRTQVMPRRPARSGADSAGDRDSAATERRTAPGRRDHPGAWRRRGLILLAGGSALVVIALIVWLLAGGVGHTTVPDLRGLPRAGVQARATRLHVDPAFSRRYSAVAAGTAVSQSPSAGTRVAQNSTVHVVLSAGPPPVKVPGVVGQSSDAAQSTIAHAGLRYGTTVVAAPGTAPGIVTRQSPRPGARAARGSTVALSVAEQPRWRSLTTFSGVDDGRSVPFRIEGRRWRATYSMSYEGSCTLVLVCFGPSAEATNLDSGSGFDGFDLSEGSSHAHTFDSGPGLYRMVVSGGQDSARWMMTVQDYY